MATDATPEQQERFGGINWGAGFFGWLVAVGVAALLTALLSAAGAAIALGEIEIETDVDVDEIGLGGAIGLVVVALIAYFAGGYVAGRMSRFDGAQQGIGVWLWAILMAVVFALLGWLADQEYNVFAQLDLPRIPAEESLTALGVAVLIVILLGTLLAAIGGGILGTRYPGRVDEAGVAPARRRADEPVRRDDPGATPPRSEGGRRDPPPRT